MDSETHESPKQMLSEALDVTCPGTEDAGNLYGYINSSCGSYEQFKVEIGNVGKHVTISAIRKFLLAQGFDTSKVKPSGQGFFFANFRSAEDRDKAVEKLNGLVFKGRPLRVKAAKPKADPLMLKRSLENGDDQTLPSKKQKSGGSPLDSSGDSVAPLSKVPYDPDQLREKQSSALSNLMRVRNIIKKVNKFKYCDSCLEFGFMTQNGRFIGKQYCPIIPSPVLKGYRNKAKFTVGFDVDGKGPIIGMRLGRYREGSTAVAYPTDAPLFSESTEKVVASMQACLDTIYNQPHSHGENADLLNRVAERVRVYDLIAKSGHWLSLTVRESRLGDRLIEIEIRRENLADVGIADVCSVIKQWFEPGGQGESVGVTSAVLISLKSISQQSGAFEEHWIFGKKTITELCCSLKFEISRDAFFQVNTLAAEKLVENIRERCKTILEKENKSTDNAILLDICCGAGVIGLCLANCFDKVIGIELVPSAVENAKRNADINGIKNAQFYAGRAEVLLKDLIRTLPQDKEIIAVLDPPRAGVHHGVIEAIRQCQRVRNLIFVACDLRASELNFEAFARPPSKKYVGAPFLPTAASCVDLFPQTPAIEAIISLKRLPAADCNHENEPPVGDIDS
ncbi:hypothetical protein Aperf_G00000069394 [Anoplocephala perfoliata]